MHRTSIKELVARNALALLEHRDGARRAYESAGVSRLVKAGLSNGVAQRLVSDAEQVNTAALDALAAGLNVQVWQLLVPNFDPAALATIEQGGYRLPEDIAERLQAATTTELLRVERVLRAALDMPDV